jgi:CRP-like cAMP-binding protein
MAWCDLPDGRRRHFAGFARVYIFGRGGGGSIPLPAIVQDYNAMENLRNFINSLSPITSGAWEAIQPLFEKRVLKKDDLLVKSGQIAREIFFLESGIIRTFYRKDDGSEYNKAFDVPPTITCGFASLITKKPSRVNLQTLTESEVWIANYSAFCKLYDEHADLERVARVAAELSFVEKENRELEMALLDATQRYELFKTQFPQLEQQILNE